MDKKLYDPSWQDVIRPQILKRDNYKCTECGVRHRSRVYVDSRKNYVECDAFMELWCKSNNKKVFTLYIQVAHLDQNKNNNDPSNLSSLCPRHHSLYDANAKKMQRIMYKKEVLEKKPKHSLSQVSENRMIVRSLQIYVEEITQHPLMLSEILTIIQITKKYVHAEKKI